MPRSEKRRAQDKAYREAHAAEIRAYNRQYYAAHREVRNAQIQAWQQRNPAQFRAIQLASRAKHREMRNERHRAQYAAHLEACRARYRAKYAAQRAAYQARARAWEAAHREQRQEIMLRYNATHREQRRLYHLTYKETYRDVIRTTQARRRARKVGAPVNDLTVAQWRGIKAAYQHQCAYCGKAAERLEMEHITPMAAGGSHTATNIVPACRPCNRHKGIGGPLVPVQPLLLTIAPRKRRA
jgi:5-methylcytosine-specific restriction endonuclease McrA